MKNYSRQREAILSVLNATNTHPTANWIYEKVRETLPNISLGTVYRNLSALTKSGDIISLNVRDGFEHFDADISPHLHLHCKNCCSITDVPLKNDPLFDEALRNGVFPESAVYVVYGICEKCKAEETKGQN